MPELDSSKPDFPDALVALKFLQREGDGPEARYVNTPESCACRKPIGWRLTGNRAMLICNERSYQAHCVGGWRSVSVTGSDRGRDLNVAAADHCSATNRPQEAILWCHQPVGFRWSLSPIPSRS